MNRFDSTLYQGLLEGLEITELRLSELARENDFLRIDSEFNLKEPLALIRRLREAGAERFGESNPVIIHPHEIAREYVDSDGVWFFRAQNLRPLAIEEGGKVYISARDATALEKNCLESGDVVITRTGANAGDCALFFSNCSAVASSHTFIVRSEAWSHPYLVAFFNSIYGRAQILRGRYGAAQPEVAPYYLRNIWIPRFSHAFCAGIGRLFERSHKQKTDAAARFAAAEKILLEALGLDEWLPPQQAITTRRLSEVLDNKRIDAEYFDPAAAAILTVLRENGAVNLEEFADVATGFPWESSQFIEDRAAAGEPFVRIRDCKPGELTPADLDKLSASYAAGCKQDKATAGDIVIGMDGLKWFYASLLTGPCYVNQRVAWLRRRASSEISSEFVLICLNSIIGQRQLLRAMTIAHTVGHIKLDDVRALLIPQLKQAVHDKITEEIRSSYASQREARLLLMLAQQAVETAIEKGEAAGLSRLTAARDGI